MEERKAEKTAQANKKWSMIRVVEVYFMLYACFDFFCQIIVQMPIVKDYQIFKSLGIRKVWNEGVAALNYAILINSTGHDSEAGLTLIMENFWI